MQLGYNFFANTVGGLLTGEIIHLCWLRRLIEVIGSKGGSLVIPTDMHDISSVARC
jgi:hypothetical protein